MDEVVRGTTAVSDEEVTGWLEAAGEAEEVDAPDGGEVVRAA